MSLPRCLGFFVLFSIVGCGSSGPPLTPVAGTIRQDGKAVAGARVRFFPTGDTKGNGGDGVTDANGAFEITAFKATTKGLPQGEYKVTISRLLRPDGSPPPPNVPLLESGASETIPEPFSNARDTPLKANVDGSAKPFDFTLPAR